MDVQMPIIDGYRATHLIRHHSPYNALARNIPIVAMTASAIQGDKEKCQKAGMDDYLAKPVKGVTLEKMLVRWAINSRSSRSPAEGHAYSGSECSESEEHNCGTAAVPMYGQGKSKKSRVPSPAAAIPDIQRPSIQERQNSHRLTLPGIETEGDRAERREHAEEKASILRDEKLVELATATKHGERPGGLGPLPLTPSEEKSEPSLQLTAENIGKLDQETGGLDGPMIAPHPKIRLPRGDTWGSTAAENGTEEGSGTPQKKRNASLERPKLNSERRYRDSEQTIKGLQNEEVDSPSKDDTQEER